MNLKIWLWINLDILLELIRSKCFDGAIFAENSISSVIGSGWQVSITYISNDYMNIMDAIELLNT